MRAATTLSLYAAQPGGACAPPGSRTAALVHGIMGQLNALEPQPHVRTHWLPPDPGREPRDLLAWFSAARGSLAEMAGPIRDTARYLLFLYPQLPWISRPDDLAPRAGAAGFLWVTLAKSWLTRQRLIVVVQDLPLEKAAGRAFADSQALESTAAKRVRRIERTLFQSAHRTLAPAGLADPLRERYGIEPPRLRTFQRHAYPPFVELSDDPPLEFDGGSVNFFYSGAVDSQIAPNFREILRSIRNAPASRLHVCGPDREAVTEWLAELDVPNAHHHGSLGVAEHDWLARRCHVGLILHPSDNPYNHLVPTLKYSAYLANGLAVLSTDLRCVAENVRRDGVGHAMPIRELSLELLRWATRPALWSEAKARAESLSGEVRGGAQLRVAFGEILSER